MHAGYEPYTGAGGGGEGYNEGYGNAHQQFRPASRTGTPRSSRGGGGGELYPTYVGGGPTVDSESVYEEHDITTMLEATNNNSKPWNRGAGPSSPKPARSSYSSPPPVSNNNRYRSSMMYAPPRSPAPSSAPAAYPPYGYENAYSMYGYGGGVGGQDGWTPPGAFPAGPQSEPSPDDYYWYAGPSPQPPPAPGSIASSNTMYGGGATHPGQFYAASGSRDDIPAGFFGINASHHHPGMGGGGSSRRGGGRAGENLPNFPQWSRTWYDGHLSANGHAYTNVPPPDGMSGWESADTLTRSGAGIGMPGSYGHIYGMRNSGNVADLVKEERIRMLEKQFGKPKISHKNGEGGGEDEDEDDLDGRDSDSIEDAELPLGAVNSKGKLVTERPKWKLIARWLIGLTAIACFALGIGSALLIKPGLNPPAARGSMASYVVYIASALNLVIIIYLFVFRPCCCDPMRKEMKGGGMNPDNPLAGMVIPVLSGGGGKPGGGKMKKNPFKGKRGGMMMMPQAAPTVNLIVDPSLLGMGGGGGKGRKSRKEGYDSEDDDDERLPGDARRSSRRKNGVGVLGNIQMQRKWMMARKTLKLETIWDSILCVIWIAVVIVALGLGKKCPPGAGNGWCNYYNGAIACGAILAVLFAFTIYLDYRDLKTSKKPPKPPM